MVTIRLFVEGSGNDNRLLKRACREGFSKFLARAGFSGRMPRIVACGSRDDAFDSFQTACDEGLPAILLVDAEEALRSESPSKHLHARDKWKFSGSDDEQVHLMVQCYSKGGHSFAILARIDPNKVRKAAPYVERLLTYLDQVLGR